MATVVKAPNLFFSAIRDKYSIFLAGAIDMGSAEDWQFKITKALEDENVVILNPRRDDWDSSWKQEKDDPQFRQQVDWEQDALEMCDLIIVVFTKDSKAPITLLELGMHIDDDSLLVCCPTGFYRKGNVDIVCERAGVPVFETIDELVERIKLQIRLNDELINNMGA